MSMSSPQNTVTLDPWKIEVLDLFVGIFDSFGMPKSMACIYGLLYCTDEALSQEEIAEQLVISAGSASQGLRLLHNLGAVHRHNPIGERLTRYSPERSMRHLLGHLINAQLRPRLNGGGERLQQIISTLPKGDHHARQKVSTLIEWQKKADRALPLISTLFGK